jgi:hypothetical protein
VDIYPEDGVWADPDLDHAAELMRRVVAHPDEAAAKGAAAREDILRRFSPAAIGALARARLEQLLRRDPPRVLEGPELASEALQNAGYKASYDPLAGVASSHPKDLAKRAALQAMRPYTFHQQELNNLLVAALREVHENVAQLQDVTVFQRRRLRRLEWRVRALEAELARAQTDSASSLTPEIPRTDKG